MYRIATPSMVRTALSGAWWSAWALLLAVVLLPSAGALAQATPMPAPRSFVWEQVDVTVRLRQDGSFRVTERNRVAFSGGPFRSGYREIPLARVERFDDVWVGEVDGDSITPYRFVAPEAFTLDVANTYAWRQDGPNLRIDWSFSETTSETRTFQLGYDAFGGLRVYDDADPPYQQISWIGVDEAVTAAAPVNEASLTFALPRVIEPGRALLDGPGGTRPEDHTDDGQTWVWRASELGPGESLAASLRFPPLVSTEAPSWQAASDRAEAAGTVDATVATLVPLASPVPQATPIAGPVDAPPCRKVMKNDFPGQRRELLADCVTDRTIFVPEDWVFDGGGHTIFAVEPDGGRFTGGVIEVPSPGSIVRNLTVDGGALTAPCLVDGGATFVAGVLVTGDAVEISDVTVRNVNRMPPDATETMTLADRKSCGMGIAVAEAQTVVVDRIAVDNAGMAGIWVEAASASLAGNSVDRATFGILALEGSGVRIGPGNEIRNGEIGVQLEGAGSGGRIVGNTIETMSQIGISFINGSQGAAVDNTLRHVGINGIAVEGPTSRATVEGNRIADAAAGIKVWQGAAVARGNTIEGGSFGIAVSNRADVTAVGNTVRGTENAGIYVRDDGTEATVGENTVDHPGSDGIWIERNARASVTDNTVRGVASDGVTVVSGADATISGNRITGGERGINVGGTGTTARITGNTLADFDVVGVTINQGAAVSDASGNTVSDALFGIIVLQADTSATVSDNTVSDLERTGLTVQEGASAELRGNRVSRARWGIALTGAGTAANLAGNRIANTTAAGIAVTTGASVTAVGNTLDQPGETGVDLDEATSALVEGNTIRGASANGIRLERVRAAAHADVVTLVSHDIYYEPTEITIPADTNVTLLLPNEGMAPHNVTIEALGIDVDLAPGATEAVIVNAPAGAYEVYCNVPGHREAGHVATLFVAPGAQVGAESDPVEPDVIHDNEISGGKNGIIVTGSGATAEVTANSIVETSGTGVAIAVGATAMVENNTVNEAGLGIDVVGAGSTASLVGNRIFDAAERGIFIQNGAEATVHKNFVTRAGTNGIVVNGQGTTAMLTGNIVGDVAESGISVEATASATIEDGNVVNGGKWGISILSDATTAEVRGNRVRAISNQGISVLYGAYAIIADNTVQGGDSGIYVRNPGSRAVITGNYVSAETRGIHVWEGASGERISDNTVRGGRSGIVIEGKDVRAVVEENRVSSSVREGIAIRDGATAELIGNSITRIGLHGYGLGIDVSGAGTKATVRQNTIAETATHGIQFSLAAQGVISDNSLDGVAQSGIRIIDAGTSGTIAGNTVRDSELVGIEVKSVEVTIVNNIVEGSGQVGIQLGSGAMARVTGNTVTGPADPERDGIGPYGIQVLRDSGGTIASNEIVDHISPRLDRTACGIVIDANALAVRVAGNLFPHPGNDQDICDERRSTAATPAPAATPIAAAPCLDPAELEPNVALLTTRTTLLKKAPDDASARRWVLASGTRLLVAPSVATSGQGAEGEECGWIAVVVAETGQPGVVPAEHVRLADAAADATP